MPKPLLTRDQLRLLKYNNIPSGKYKTNSDLGIPALRYFDEEVKNIVICGEMAVSFQQKIYKNKNKINNELT